MKQHLALLAGMVFLASGMTARTGNYGTFVAPLDDGLWSQTQWISAADAPEMNELVNDTSLAADGASWFLTTVKNAKKVKAAQWMATSLGVFDLYVNGKAIGEEVLKPGFTHYKKTKYSFTYDITDAVNTSAGAVNNFAVEVTPGWWGDKIITPNDPAVQSGNPVHEPQNTESKPVGMLGKKPAYRGVIKLTYDDGTSELVNSDTTSWKAGIAGPVTHAGIFDGEHYDARIPQGFLTPEKMSTPVVNTEFTGQIFPSAGAEVYYRHDLLLKPVEAYIWQGVTGADDEHHGTVNIKKKYKPCTMITINPGETLVVDFGQNASAVPVFEFSAPEGTNLTVLPAEILNDGNGAYSRDMDGPEGSVHRRNLRMYNEGLAAKYTFGPQRGFVNYHPHKTFFGYRYISVTADKPVKIKSVVSLPVTSIARKLETGNITTGHPTVNRLISNTLWGQRSNYLSVPTDCPQRNERLGWTADTQVFSETGTFFANTKDFFHKWMRDMRDTQNEHGSFPGVAPFAQYGACPTDYMRVGWSDAGVIVPWVVWKQFGDTNIVDENWEAMEKYMDHVNQTRYDHRAALDENGNYSWADWLSYEPLESCSGRKDYPNGGGVRPETIDYWNYLNANYWLMDAEMMRDMARNTGRDADRYQAMADEARQYIRDNFFTRDGRFRTDVLNTMQTPALFALKNNIPQGKAREDMIARLRQNFADHGNCLQTGFLGTSILMPTLTENGMEDIAYEVLFQRNNPSWFYSIDNGATTIWERWNSYMKDKGMGPNGMNSFNHYAYGVVCQWMWESMAGISADPLTPGFKHIILKPVPDRRLGFVDATYKSVAGPVRSAWRYEGDKWIWNFSIPEGSTATVTIPGHTQSKEYTSGTYTITL